MKTKLNSLQKKVIDNKLNFEELNSSELMLKGGFSNSVGGVDNGLDDGISNNCLGGNCAINCDSHQNNACNKGCYQ